LKLKTEEATMARHSINSKRLNAKKHGGRVKGGGFDAAPGNSGPASSEMQPTPAPVKKFVAPDVISTPRKAVNAPMRSPPSVIPPGVTLLSPLSEVLKQDGDDGSLDKIIAGTEQPDDQLRQVSAEPYPSAGGMKRQQDPNFFAKKPS